MPNYTTFFNIDVEAVRKEVDQIQHEKGRGNPIERQCLRCKKELPRHKLKYCTSQCGWRHRAGTKKTD